MIKPAYSGTYFCFLFFSANNDLDAVQQSVKVLLYELSKLPCFMLTGDDRMACLGALLHCDSATVSSLCDGNEVNEQQEQLTTILLRKLEQMSPYGPVTQTRLLTVMTNLQCQRSSNVSPCINFSTQSRALLIVVFQSLQSLHFEPRSSDVAAAADYEVIFVAGIN